MVVLAAKMAGAVSAVLSETEKTLFVSLKLLSEGEKIKSAYEKILSVPQRMLSLTEMKL